MFVTRLSILFSLFLFSTISLYSQEIKRSLISPPVNNVFDFYLSSSAKVYFGNPENLWIFDLNGDSLQHHSRLDLSSDITAIIASEERNEVFLGTKDGCIAQIDINNKMMTHFICHQGDQITSLAFNSEKNFLIAGGTRGVVYKHRVADIESFEVLYSCSDQVTDIELSSAGDYLSVCDGTGLVSLFDASDLSLISSTRVSDGLLRDLAFVLGTERFVTVDEKGIFSKWRISQSKYLINVSESRESYSGLLCVDVNSEGTSFCFGGKNHQFYVQTPFGSYKNRLQGPVLKSSFFEKDGYLFFVHCLYGKGIVLTSLAGM
ncbi:WD40 repeat domain-containing protein [Marinilabilia sp.]|uniref:WD40 repeat domain-containing protein n=1 Tax=Marinilabilia sp. TaxID=2021252 RepID=UPI0025BFC34E|nr:WD40 repeat domain-containing protein [Marinilabilia sp.]